MRGHLQLEVTWIEYLIGNKEKKSVNNQISNRILVHQPTWILLLQFWKENEGGKCPMYIQYQYQYACIHYPDFFKLEKLCFYIPWYFFLLSHKLLLLWTTFFCDMFIRVGERNFTYGLSHLQAQIREGVVLCIWRQTRQYNTGSCRFNWAECVIHVCNPTQWDKALL